MKKTLLIFMIVSIMASIACNRPLQPAADKEDTETLLPAANEEGHIVTETAPPKTESDIGILMEVSDGQQYGCDVVCWFDGFGFCYNVESEKEGPYKIELSNKLTAAEVYSDNDKLSFPEDSIGYCVYLCSETVSYRIGFLRILEEPHIWGYGTLFELLTEEDPQAELLPEDPQVGFLWENDAAWFEDVNEDGSILIQPTFFEETDVGFDEVDDVEEEPFYVEITDESCIMICFFDSQRPGMIVTKERMMQLVLYGYFTEYPCWVIVKDGKLEAAMQINSF